MGHIFVTGARLGGGERDATLTLGQTYGATAQALPPVQYVALGHVHRPQRVPGSAVPARYAGSLIQLDFSESGHQKSVALVDVRPGKPAEVREVPITAGRQLIEVSGTMDELARHRDSAASAFLKVTLRCDGPQPGLAEQVTEMLPHAIAVYIDYPRDDAAALASVRNVPPREQFAAYYAARYQAHASAAMLALFDEVLTEATGG
jgi:exonuclease SbcD